MVALPIQLCKKIQESIIMIKGVMTITVNRTPYFLIPVKLAILTVHCENLYIPQTIPQRCEMYGHKSQLQRPGWLLGSCIS
jgi:hypothetical protein